MTPTQRLEQEHEKILLLLSVLERLARRVTAGEKPLEQIDQTLDLLRTFADGAHHGKEERHLFPALHGVGLPQYAGPVAVMLLEHDAGRNEIADMADGLFELRCGVEAGAGRFARAASRYCTLLSEHIMKENEVLFPMACELLPPEAAETLTGDYADVDRETFGEGGYAKAVARIDALAAAVLQGDGAGLPKLEPESAPRRRGCC